MKPNIIKSIITLTVLHRDDENINEMSLGRILNECDEGEMIGGEMSIKSTKIRSKKVLTRELLNIGNDGEFFNEC